jgi:hypothetical protein
MPEIVELMRVGVPTVVVPAAVFGGNWAIRFRSDYAQTAAADFVLGILVFDAVVFTSAKEFEPFVHNIDLQQIVFYWHFCVAVAGAGLWWLIVTFGEPRVEDYYRTGRHPAVFFGTLMLCWMMVFFLVALHVGFFIWSGGQHA